MRLIDADALREEFVWLMNNVNAYNQQAVYETIERLDRQPTIDAEPVIRCKDCVHWRLNHGRHMCNVFQWSSKENDFCSFELDEVEE